MIDGEAGRHTVDVDDIPLVLGIVPHHHLGHRSPKLYRPSSLRPTIATTQPSAWIASSSMARSGSSRTPPRAVRTSIVAGVAVALAPRAWLTVVTDVVWEQSLISLTGLAAAGLAAGLPWALNVGGALARRSCLWVMALVAVGTIYAISVAPFYLVAAFCTAFVGMLDVWMARADVAARSLRARLEKPNR